MTARLVKYLLVIGLIALLILGGNRFLRSAEEPAPADDGRTITGIIDAKLVDSVDLRVKRLRGKVQVVAVDERGAGMLVSKLVMTAPFEADYFIDLARLDRGDFLWDGRTRTLIVTVPDVRIGAVDVDEAHAAVRITGPFVTRAAMVALRQNASTTSGRVARDEALKPALLDRVREDGRAIVAALYERPLRVALPGVRVRVRYAGETESDREQMDRSRSLAEIYAG